MNEKSRITFSGGVLTSLAPDGTPAWKFNVGDIHPGLVNAVIAYGAKQIIQDAGASPVDRDANIAKRMRGLIDGTYGFRDGLSVTTSVKALRDLQYVALVACGAMADSAETRAAWVAAKPSERAAVFAAVPAAAEYMPKPAAAPAPLMARLGIPT